MKQHPASTFDATANNHDLNAIERERLLRCEEVMRRTGLSRQGIYMRARRGVFPQKIKLGKRAVAWREADVDRWISELLSAQTSKGKERSDV